VTNRDRAHALVLVQCVLLVTLTLGCQLTPNFKTGYEIEKGLLRSQPMAGSLAVRDFREERPPRYYSSPNRIWMTYIPILPYVSLPYERLDETVEVISDEIEGHGRGITFGAAQAVAPPFEEYRYPSSFARAIADDLAAAALFESVDYVGASEPTGHRYVLDGVMRKTPLEWDVTSFCLGPAGVLLWLLPIPMAKTSASADVDLTLTEQPSGRVVWKHTLHSEISRLTSLYTSSALLYGRAGPFSFQVVPPPKGAGVDDRSLFGWHFGALRRAMLEARDSLSAALGEED
jgi:hypothetical protein